MKLIALTLGMFALGCSSEADIGNSNQQLVLCDPTSCPDPGPLSPNYECPDGTIAGPACVEASTGTCGWQVLQCEGSGTCSTADCGPAPGAPNWTCPDGTIAGPSCGPSATAAGGCGWTIVQCPSPAVCQPGDCPDPAPASPNFQCPDGTIGGPACRPSSTTGGCGWTIVQCPTPSTTH